MVSYLNSEATKLLNSEASKLLNDSPIKPSILQSFN